MFLNSNPLLDAIFGGYQTAATIVAHSGQPFTVTMASSNSHAQAGNQFPNVVGDWHLSSPGINGWYNTAAFTPAADGTFGNERRNSLVGPGLNTINFSLGKNITVREGVGLQLRVDAVNILNHPAFGLPNCAGNGNNCTPSISFDSTGKPTTIPNITTTTIGSRGFQLDGRVSF